MSKKLITSRFNLVGLIKKGKAMYDKYNVIEPAENIRKVLAEYNKHNEDK